ncbi:hypothetical protein FB570_110229 [Streptomyces sp. T12]|nr:hypothetical protein FB570_110229 [Streptomyces sp. T12]
MVAARHDLGAAASEIGFRPPATIGHVRPSGPRGAACPRATCRAPRSERHRPDLTGPDAFDAFWERTQDEASDAGHVLVSAGPVDSDRV